MKNTKKWFDSELNFQQKTVVLLLAGSALFAVIMLIIFTSPTMIQRLKSIFARPNPEWIYGNSQDYLPGVAELPAGFRMVGSESGPIQLDHGNFYRSLFTNPDLEQQQREVNILYSAGVYDDVEIAKDAYGNFSDTDFYSRGTTSKPFSQAEFTNVDDVSLLFSQTMTKSGAMSIGYTLVFRYRNFTASIGASSPVKNYYDEYAMQLQTRLKQAAIFYASFLINKLPVDPLMNVPQPPFGEFMSSTEMFFIEPTRGIIIESTYTPNP